MSRRRVVQGIALAYFCSALSEAGSYSMWKPGALEIEITGDVKAKTPKSSPFLITKETAPEAAQLLRAIQREHHDDTPRLVYADWLQEHGEDAAAQFIRLQCEIAKIPRPKNYRQMVIDSRALLDRHEAAWFGPLERQFAEFREARELPDKATSPLDYAAFHFTLHRGFPWGVRLAIDSVYGEDNPARPIRQFRANVAAAMRRISAIEPGIVALDISAKSSSLREVAQVLLAHQSIEQFEALQLEIGYHTDFELLDAARVRRALSNRLRELKIKFISGSGEGSYDTAGEYFGSDPVFRRLHSLSFRSELGSGSATALQTRSVLEGLTRSREGVLPFSEMRDFSFEHAWLGTAETSLAALPRAFPNLRSLNFPANNLKDADIVRLMQGKWEHLVQLDLSQNSFGDAGVEAIAKSPLAAKLLHLDISKEPSDSLYHDLTLHPGVPPTRQGKDCDALVLAIASIYH